MRAHVSRKLLYFCALAQSTVGNRIELPAVSKANEHRVRNTSGVAAVTTHRTTSNTALNEMRRALSSANRMKSRATIMNGRAVLVLKLSPCQR